MRLLAPAALVALALAACTQQASDDAGVNDVAADETAPGTDPATTDLELNSTAPAVDQAIEETNEQSGFDNAVGGTANSASETVQ